MKGNNAVYHLNVIYVNVKEKKYHLLEAQKCSGDYTASNELYLIRN